VKGIPRFGAFLDSNDSFCMHRKFGNPTSYLLVSKELELQIIIDELNELHVGYAAQLGPNGEQNSNLWTTVNQDPVLKQKLQELDQKLNSYCKYSTIVSAIGTVH
jgi:hypothetical protein